MIYGLDTLIKEHPIIDAKTYYQLITTYGEERVKNYLYDHIMESFAPTKDFYQNQLEIFKKYGYYLATLKKVPYQEELEKTMYRNLEKEEENNKKENKILTQKEEIYYGFHLLKRPYLHILKEDNNNITLDLYKIIHSIKTKEMAEYFLTKFDDFYQLCPRTSNFDIEFKKILKQYRKKYLEGHIPSVNDFNLTTLDISNEVLSDKYLKDQLEMYIDYSIARNQFESYNNGLIKSYINKCQLNQNEEDFFQEGILGVIRAVDTFDIRMGYRFSGYALASINNYISRSKTLTQNTVHIPVNLYTKLKFLQSKQREEYIKTGRNISLKEVMDRLNISKNMQENLLTAQLCLLPHSLNEIIFERDGWNSDVQLEDLVLDNKISIEEEILRRQTSRELLKLMDEKLDEREKDILLKRSGYLTGEAMTLEEIGAQYGFTRENIRIIQKKAMKKLKKSPKVNDLNPYQ